jgi:hypothetical protein
MRIKKLAARLIFGQLPIELERFGEAIEERLVEALSATPMEKYADLLQLKNLQGEITGYVRTYHAPRMEKLACLSINILPGMRYFNIHAIPDHHYLVPRFNFEGMITTRGSQVSMDLYPDMDVISNFDYITKHYEGVARIYEKAKQHKHIRPGPSRLPHLRALCSPYFLLANSVQVEQLPDMQQWALGYLDEWLKIYAHEEELRPQGATARLERRLLIARTIIENDPDRDKVVDTFGEQTTQAIENAAML